MKFPKIIIALAATAALVACGGGDDEVALQPDPVPTPAPAPTPTPATTLSTGFEQSGVLNYLVYAADGKTRNMTAVVDYVAPNGKVTFEAGTSDAFDATTKDGWESIAWASSQALSVAIRANGNTGLVCGGGTTQVAVSQNMAAVPDAKVLRGTTFERTRCEGGAVVKVATPAVFNADGTALTESGSTLTAVQVDAMFSAGGLDLGNNWNIKLRLYAYTVGGRTQYHIVRIFEDGLTTNSQRSATLMSPAS